MPPNPFCRITAECFLPEDRIHRIRSLKYVGRGLAKQTSENKKLSIKELINLCIGIIVEWEMKNVNGPDESAHTYPQSRKECKAEVVVAGLASNARLPSTRSSDLLNYSEQNWQKYLQRCLVS